MAHLRICWCGRTYRHEAAPNYCAFDYAITGYTPPAMPPAGMGDWWEAIRLPVAGRCPEEQEHGPPPSSPGVSIINALRDNTVRELSEHMDKLILRELGLI